MAGEEFLVAIILLCLLYFFLDRYERHKHKKLIKKYKEEEDAGRKGEEKRRSLGKGTDIRRVSAVENSELLSQLRGQQPVQTPIIDEPPRPPIVESNIREDVGNIGEDINSTGKTGKSPRGIFARFRRRK